MAEQDQNTKKPEFENKDGLAFWAITVCLFGFFRLFIGGIAGSTLAGGLAGFAAFEVLKRRPAESNGRRLPALLSIALLLLGIGLFVLPYYLL